MVYRDYDTFIDMLCNSESCTCAMWADTTSLDLLSPEENWWGRLIENSQTLFYTKENGQVYIPLGGKAFMRVIILWKFLRIGKGTLWNQQAKFVVLQGDNW